MIDRTYYDNRIRELRRLADRLKELGMQAEAQTLQMASVDLGDLSAKVEANEKIIREFTGGFRGKDEVAPAQQVI